MYEIGQLRTHSLRSFVLVVCVVSHRTGSQGLPLLPVHFVSTATAVVFAATMPPACVPRFARTSARPLASLAGSRLRRKRLAEFTPLRFAPLRFTGGRAPAHHGLTCGRIQRNLRTNPERIWKCPYVYIVLSK